MPNQKRRLQNQRHPFDHTAGRNFRVSQIRQLGPNLPDRTVDTARLGAGQRDLTKECFDRARLLGYRPQHIKRRNVSAALPNSVERGLPEQTRHLRFLDKAVATEALHSLSA